MASLLAAGVLWISGCLGDRCDPGQILTNGQCVATSDALPPDSGQGDLGASTPDAGGAGDMGAGDTVAQNLGQACVKSEDCDGVASFCVVMPGQTTGYCTIKDCTITPNDCPKGYTCMDISSYVPGIPNLCIKQ